MTSLLENTFAVAAIENGTVIDHIPAGKALEIARLLGLQAHTDQVYIGMNLPSVRLEKKDLLKIGARMPTALEEQIISIIAPGATINIIEAFTVIRKYKTETPAVVTGIACCKNQLCITNHEQVPTCFYVKIDRNGATLRCHHCRKHGTLILC